MNRLLMTPWRHKDRSRKTDDKKAPVSAAASSSSSFITTENRGGNNDDDANANDDGVVFYDCLSTPRNAASPSGSGACSGGGSFSFSRRASALRTQPRPRTFPFTLSKHHRFVTLEEYAKLKKSDPDRLRNTYSEPCASQFQVRGPNYLCRAAGGGMGGKNMKHLKIASQESAYEVVGVNMFQCPQRPTYVSREIQPLRRFLEANAASQDEDSDADKELYSVFPKFLVINWIVSPLFGSGCHVCSHVFRLKPDVVRGKQHLRSAFERFRGAPDAEKSNQFKWLSKMVEGPRALAVTISVLGAERPVLICNQLATTFDEGVNYMEITNDVSSSRIAAANCGSILRNLGAVVMDMAWLLEAQRTQDLPENVLCSIRWIWNTMDELVIPLDEHGELTAAEQVEQKEEEQQQRGEIV